ncbi:hypothetical protein V2J09_023225 [Rumex salicifolius]
MTVQFIVLYAISLIFTYAVCALPNPGPSFAFSWLGDNNKFIAGDNATIRIKVLGSFDFSAPKHAFVPSISVNEKPGNSSFVSSLCFNLVGDPGSWSVSFVPISVGVFNVLITEDRFGVLDSSLQFFVDPGPMNPSMSVASWMDSVNEFVAGTRAMALVLPKDAFGNKILTTVVELDSYVFNVSASYDNGSVASVLSVSSLGWNHYGYLRIEFIAATAGKLLLHIIEGTNQKFQGSPLPFIVLSGTVNTSKCVAKWKYGSNILQLNSASEIFIDQIDAYGNLVPGLYPLDAEVVEAGTNLSIPVSDLRFEALAHGVQLLTFSAVEPGNFLLLIYDAKNNRSISNVPYHFTVFVGYCDELNSIINGTGLNTSIAGQEASFSVYLHDKYQYPSPVEMQMLQVQITQENNSSSVIPSISPTEIGSWIPGKPHESIGYEELAPHPSFAHSNVSAGNSSAFTYAYNVLYTPEKAGIYDICVSCGNIMLNDGHPLKKEVRAAEVNISMSAVVRYAPKVQKKVKSEIVISLMDSFSNPVLSQESRLKVEINSTNHLAYSTWKFLDNRDGSYTGYYLVEEVGTYELCASIDGYLILPCPSGVNAYSDLRFLLTPSLRVECPPGEYFPKACDDSVSVWEDESVAFNVLGNDYFAGDNVTIIDFSHPRQGSILHDGPHFRYTPHKEFYGNDSFTYSISDVNGNVATASVKISILSIPPQFVSFPAQLRALEDFISPKFGGFHGFEITYPDPQENIMITLNASFGTVSLYPMLVNFWKPSWNDFSVSTGDEEAGSLMFMGHIEVINTVLNSIQYLGNENFFGEDIIRITIRNENAANDVYITVSVDPVNDPPYIRAPEYIVLEYNGEGKGSSIYKKEKDEFEFMIGDPDFSNFPGDKSQFLVMLSIEVDSGALEATLPAELINTTELKLKKNRHWQPLQTYVSISKHFKVKAKGLRIHATLNDCNSVIQQLKFHGEEDDGALLTLSVNDLGNYGCNPDCSDNMSRPLFVEANIILLNRRPISSLAAYGQSVRQEAKIVIVMLVDTLSLLAKMDDEVPPCANGPWARRMDLVYDVIIVAVASLERGNRRAFRIPSPISNAQIDQSPNFIRPEQAQMPGHNSAPVVADDEHLVLAELVDERHQIAD